MTNDAERVSDTPTWTRFSLFPDGLGVDPAGSYVLYEEAEIDHGEARINLHLLIKAVSKVAVLRAENEALQAQIEAQSKALAEARIVKPLEWSETSWQNDIAIRWTSSGPFHLLIKRNLSDPWFTYDGRHFTALAEAKAVAEIDHQQRILSALVTPTPENPNG